MKKGCGIFSLIVALVNLVSIPFAISQGANAEWLNRAFSGIFIFLVVGAFLIYLGNKDKRRKQELEEWEKQKVE